MFYNYPMLIVKIALGLAGLGVVVFVHELGHFLAARLVGIDVEAFSIGWGNPFLKKKINGVEYRLGMFPIGGYCKMRGENELAEAWEKRTDGIEPVKGTYYGATPLDRIIVAVAGPLFNLIFAVLVLSVIWGVGFEVNTLDSRIVLVSEYETDALFPADKAGFQTGDRIIEINGKRIENYHEIQENIAINPGKLLPVKVERQGEIIDLSVRPELDKNSGAGRLGVFAWNDLIIAEIIPDSTAANAGLLPGDRIIRVNGGEVANTIDFIKAYEENPETTTIDYLRNGTTGGVTLPQWDKEKGPGIHWSRLKYRTPVLSPPAALAKGAAESWKTFSVSLKSLSLLFQGINLTKAVSGPVRITYMVGEAATEGFGRGFGTGLRSLAEFLSLISIALAVMNLLPLPVLDGGIVVLSVVEIVRRKPTHPRAIKVLQTVGVTLIFSIMIFAIFGDILYFAHR